MKEVHFRSKLCNQPQKQLSSSEALAGWCIFSKLGKVLQTSLDLTPFPFPALPCNPGLHISFLFQHMTDVQTYKGPSFMHSTFILNLSPSASIVIWWGRSLWKLTAALTLKDQAARAGHLLSSISQQGNKWYFSFASHNSVSRHAGFWSGSCPNPTHIMPGSFQKIALTCSHKSGVHKRMPKGWMQLWRLEHLRAALSM